MGTIHPAGNVAHLQSLHEPTPHDAPRDASPVHLALASIWDAATKYPGAG
jgi:hypothetical protein